MVGTSTGGAHLNEPPRIPFRSLVEKWRRRRRQGLPRSRPERRGSSMTRRRVGLASALALVGSPPRWWRFQYPTGSPTCRRVHDQRRVRHEHCRYNTGV
jgi:hypothetical protein